MKRSQQNEALTSAVRAARAAGSLIRANARATKTIASSTQHDIKLEMDVRCQKLIESSLRKDFPETAVLGEEGVSGNISALQRWVIDPIDGTVNFTYGIPHACISIAFQERNVRRGDASFADGYDTQIGVVYDPFCDELWTAIAGQPARMNGNKIHVSTRHNLKEGVVSLGFSKTRENIQRTLPYFGKLVHRVRKIRIMGSAALAMTYVASGRFDAYVESDIRLWDVAAGGLIIECAGGEFWRKPLPGEHAYRVIASNGLLRRTLRVPS